MCKELQTNIYIANNKHTQSKISYLWNENVCSDRHIALSLHQCIALFSIYLLSLSLSLFLINIFSEISEQAFISLTCRLADLRQESWYVANGAIDARNRRRWPPSSHIYPFVWKSQHTSGWPARDLNANPHLTNLSGNCGNGADERMLRFSGSQMQQLQNNAQSK